MAVAALKAGETIQADTRSWTELPFGDWIHAWSNPDLGDATELPCSQNRSREVSSIRHYVALTRNCPGLCSVLCSTLAAPIQAQGDQGSTRARTKPLPDRSGSGLVMMARDLLA